MLRSEGQGVPSRCIMAMGAGEGKFQGKGRRPQGVGGADSVLGLWCWRPRLGLPSGAKNHQHCSA